MLRCVAPRSEYETGTRSRYWLKIKPTQVLDCVVCGLTKGEGWREEYFGVLILGCHINDKLTYVGRVGSGFDDADLEMILEAAGHLAGDCLFESVPNIGVEVWAWLQPYLVCRVEYSGLSRENRLRAPRYRGLRLDKSAAECRL